MNAADESYYKMMHRHCITQAQWWEYHARLSLEDANFEHAEMCFGQARVYRQSEVLWHTRLTNQPIGPLALQAPV